MSEATPRKYRRYDWPSLKMVYVEGVVDDDGNRTWKSLSEVAELFEVPAVRVRERSARDHWVEERQNFQDQLERQRQEMRSKELAQNQLDIDKRAHQIAKAGMQLITHRLGEITTAVTAQAKAAQERAQAGLEPDRSVVSAVDAGEVGRLVNAGSEAYALAQKALGVVPTTRHEVTGVDGGPVRTQQDVKVALTQDDPDRLTKFFLAADRAGLVTIAGLLPDQVEAGEPPGLPPGSDDPGGDPEDP